MDRLTWPPKEDPWKRLAGIPKDHDPREDSKGEIVLTCEELPLQLRPVVRETQNIRKEIKRLTQHIANIRQMKKKHEETIYRYMVENDVKKIDEITRSSIKPRTKRKPLKEKKRDAYALFQDEGIQDPETFWTRLQRTQKYVKKMEGEEGHNEDGDFAEDDM